MKSQNRTARLPFALFSAGVNVALFAAAAPALANNHPFAMHSQSQMPVNAHFGGALPASLGGALPSNFGTSHTSASVAGSLPLASYTQPLQHFNHTHTNMMHAADMARVFAGNDQVNLNLNSSKTSIVITPSVVSANDSVTISVGGTDKTFHMGDVVTPGELVAIYQAKGGSQTIDLDKTGRADGGTFSINNVLNGPASVHISSLVIPKNVTAIDNLGANQDFHLSGNLLNYGTIQGQGGAVGGGASEVNISALNIVNAKTGLITTVIQDSKGALGSADLSLAALNQFQNAGAITSSGNLSVSSNNITNSGLLSSLNGNVTLGGAPGPQAQDMWVNNTGGTISAANGAINVRDAAYSGVANTYVYGGNLLSQQVNLNAGAGTTNVDVDQLTGVLSSIGNAVHVQASTDNLVLGKQCLTGDPTFYNDAGSITIDGDITVSESLAIVASGDILATSKTKNIIAQDADSGFDITMIAGASITPITGTPTNTIPPFPASSSIQVNGASGTGGSVDLTGADPALGIDASAPNFSGGNVTFAAFSGSAAGRVVLPTGSQINTTAVGPDYFSGKVTVIAGASSGVAISVGNIVGGNISLINSQPTITNGPLAIDTTGKITSGAIGADLNARSGGNIVLNGIFTDSGNSLAQLVTSGKVIFNNASVNYNQLLVVADAGVTLSGANLVTRLGTVMVTQNDIVASGTGSLANTEAFALTMVAGANYTIAADPSGNINQVSVTGPSLVGGNIDLSAGSYSIDASAVSGGAGNAAVLAAFRQAAGPQINGNIKVGSIAASGNSSGANGSIEITAGSMGAVPITTGPIHAENGLTGTGSVTLVAAQPNAITPVDVFNTVPTFLGSTVDNVNGTISTGTISLNGGNLTITQGGQLNVPSVLGNVGTYAVSAGQKAIISNPLLNVGFLYVFSNQIDVNSSINAANTALISAGGVNFGGGSSITGGGIVVVARGDIKATGFGITINTDTANGAKPLTMIAGADYNLSGTDLTDIKITGQFGSGGLIDFAIGSNVASFGSASSTGAGNTTTLAAFSDNSSKGSIFFNGAPITAGGASGKAAGEVVLVSGRQMLGGIQVQGIDVSTGTNGNIYASASQPNVTGLSPLEINLATSSIVSGTVKGGPIVAGGGTFSLSNVKMNGGTLAYLVDTGITTSSDFGSVTGAGTVVASSNGSIFVNSSIGTAAIQLLSQQSIQILSDIIAPGGISLIAAKDVIAGGTVSLATSSASGAGQLNIVAGATFSFDGTKATVTSVSGNGSIDLSNTIAINSRSSSGAGGDMNFVAGKTITLNPSSGILTDGATTNGSVTMVAGLTGGTAITTTDIDLTNVGASTGSGGKVLLQSGTLNVSASSPLVFSSTKFLTGSLTDVNFNSNSDISAADIKGTSGSTIQILSSRNVVTGDLDVGARVGSFGSGGKIEVVARGTETLVIGGVQGTSKNFIGSLLATPDIGGGQGGSIAVSNIDTANAGNGGIKLASPTSINVGGISGGSIALIAGRAAGDDIALGAQDTLTVNQIGAGASGAITLIGNKVTTDSGALNLSANGVMTGGSITYVTADTTALVLDNSSKLNFSATGLSVGGTIVIEHGGNVTYDPTSTKIVFNPTAAGTGGNLTLHAGFFNNTALAGGNANLLVTGSLKADGSGASGNGGNFDLASNSPTVFNIGATTKNTNGVMGTISVAGTKNGSISAGNAGGGLTNSVALTKVDTLTLFAGGTGDLIIGAPVGTPQSPINPTGPHTSLLTLINLGTGSIVQSKSTNTIGAETVSTVVASGSVGGKSTLTVDAPNLQVNATGNATISDTALNVSLKSTTVLGVFTLTAANNIALSDITAGSVNIKAKSVGLGGDILASKTGNVTIAATTGDIAELVTNDISAGGTITLSALNGNVIACDLGTVLAPSKIIGTALYGFGADTIHANDSITIKTTSPATGSGIVIATDVIANNPSSVVTLSAVGAAAPIIVGGDIAAGKSITVTATNGAILVSGGVGAVVQSPGALTMTSALGIEIDGAVFAVNSITLKTTTTSNSPSVGNIDIPLSIATTSPTAGVISITSSGAGPAIKANLIDASKSITLTASRGDVVVDTVGASAPNPGAVSITANSSITVNNSITAVNTIALKTTGKAIGQGDITTLGNILATSSKGSVTVTSSSQSNGILGSGDFTGGTVTLSAPKASIVTGSIGNGPTGKGVTSKVVISALSGITISNQIFANTSVSATNTGAGAPIQMLNSITVGTTSTTTTVGTGTVALTTTGKISSTSGVSIFAGKSVAITSSKGDIDLQGNTGDAGFQPNTVTIKAFGNLNTGFINSIGAVSVSTTGKGAGDALTVNGDILTANAPISIIASGSFLNVIGANIFADSASAKTKATVLIENSNKTGGFINLTNADIRTLDAGGGDVNIAIGAPGKGFNTTVPGPGVNVDNSKSPSNHAFFGTPGAVDPASSGSLILQGKNIIFTSNLPNSILFTGTQIIADPPVGQSVALVATGNHAAVIAPALAGPALFAPVLSAPLMATAPAPTSDTSSARTIQSGDFQQIVAGLSQLNQSTLPSLQGEHNQPHFSRMISETELAGGEVPVALLSGGNVELGAAVSQDAADFVGGTDAHLERGSLLAVPAADTVVKTAYGDVSVAGKSVALIVATSRGLAVFNLDDRKSDAVTVKAGGKNISIRPGTSAFIVSESVRSLEQINPVQLVSHRRIYEQQLGQGLKAFRSEFAVQSAFAALKPLRHMVRSTDKQTRETANHLLKTISILVQLQSGGEDFKRVLRPQLTAMVQ